MASTNKGHTNQKRKRRPVPSSVTRGIGRPQRPGNRKTKDKK